MGKKHLEGFTLIELLVLMMVLAVATGIGVPALFTFVANARMSGAGNDLVSSLHVARSEALARNRTVTLCASSGTAGEPTGCDASAGLLDGWIMFVDTDADGFVDEREQLLQAHGPVSDAIRRNQRSGADAGPPQYLSFRGDGLLQGIDALGPAVRNIQLCDERGDRVYGKDLAAGRWIIISPAGRPTLIDRGARLQGDSNPLGGCGGT